MQYFTNDTLAYLADLKENNVREWYHANKDRFVNHVKKPFEVFVDRMIQRVQELDSSVVIRPKDAIFRLARDTRFSKDKTPYKTHISAIISKGGRKDMQDPGLYLQIDAEELRIYSGLYKVEPKILKKIRAYMAEHNDELISLIEDPQFNKKFGEVHGEKNKRIDKEFREAGEIQPLIYNKGWYYYAILDSEKILKANLDDIIMDYYKAALPLNEYFKNAIDS